MALTLAVCVGGFTVLYTLLEPMVSDFVSRTDPVPTPTAVVAQAEPTEAAATGTAQARVQTEPTAAPTDAPAPTDTPAPPDEFTPDYQIAANQPVNLRAGPGANAYEPIIAVPIDAPLMFLNEREPTADPAGDGLNPGDEWMKFRTEDGEEGWIREIDVTTYQP